MGQMVYGSAVAICQGSTPLFGAIYDIANNDSCVGGTMHPATCNGEPVAVSEIGQPDQACLMTGLPVGGRLDRDGMSRLANDFSGRRKVRMIRSAAVSLMHVAAGHTDHCREDGIFWRDAAAGLAIPKAAGGVYVVEGAPASTSPLYFAAGCPRLLSDVESVESAWI